MFIAIDLSFVEQSEDGRTVTLRAIRPESNGTVFGKMAMEAEGTVKVTLPPSIRLCPGDVITGCVRRGQ